MRVVLHVIGWVIGGLTNVPIGTVSRTLLKQDNVITVDEFQADILRSCRRQQDANGLLLLGVVDAIFAVIVTFVVAFAIFCCRRRQCCLDLL